MGTAKVFSLVKEFDRSLIGAENTVIDFITEAYSSSFDQLELEIRRRFPQMEAQGSLVAAQQNSIILLGQLKTLLQLLSPDELSKITTRLEKLYTEVGVETAALNRLMVQTIEPGATVLAPRIVPEAVRYAAERSVTYFQKYGQEFAHGVGITVAQGLIQGWGVDKTVREMRKVVAIPINRARAVVRTESLQASDHANRAAMEASGIDYVCRCATEDRRTCVWCASRAGEITRRDQTVASLHVSCRCCLIPVRPSWVKLGLFDLDWVRKHAATLHKDLAEPLNQRQAPFEKSNDTPRVPVLWTPTRGFVDPKFKQLVTN
ncbi:MAG: minor capsid protein [Stenomitos frigidus ULC029]